MGSNRVMVARSDSMDSLNTLAHTMKRVTMSP